MKIVIGIFEPDAAEKAIGSLTQNGYDPSDLSMLSSAADLSFDLEDEIEGEPEENALT